MKKSLRTVKQGSHSHIKQDKQDTLKKQKRGGGIRKNKPLSAKPKQIKKQKIQMELDIHPEKGVKTPWYKIRKKPKVVNEDNLQKDKKPLRKTRTDKRKSKFGFSKKIVKEPPKKEWEFITDLGDNNQETTNEESKKYVTDISHERVIRKDILKSTDIHSLSNLDRLKLAFKVRRVITKKEAIEQEKKEIARIEHEQRHFFSLKYFIEKAIKPLYDNVDQRDTVVIQIDPKFNVYLPMVIRDMTYLDFEEVVINPDILRAYKHIPRLFKISVKKGYVD